MTPDVHLSVYLRVFLFSWSIIYPSRLKPRTARTSQHALFFSLLPIKCSALHTQKKQTNKTTTNKQTNTGDNENFCAVNVLGALNKAATFENIDLI